jgi:hypothetical protein
VPRHIAVDSLRDPHPFLDRAAHDLATKLRARAHFEVEINSGEEFVAR